jgi:hypothetical protein
MKMTALALRLKKSAHTPVAAAAACTVVLLLVGSLYSSNFLSADYLLLQLQIASFLGVVATGAMLVIGPTSAAERGPAARTADTKAETMKLARRMAAPTWLASEFRYFTSSWGSEC